MNDYDPTYERNIIDFDKVEEGFEQPDREKIEDEGD